MDRLRPSLAAVLAVSAFSASWSGCKCNKETDTASDAGPPPRGRSSTKELSTNIGSARGLSGIAPSTTEWTRVFPIDGDRLVIAGSSPTEAVAILTDDGGETWRALSTEKKRWASWSFGEEGALLLANGTREKWKGKKKPPKDQLRPIDTAFLHFTAADSERIGAPSPLLELPDGGAPVPGLRPGQPLKIPSGAAIGAVLSRKSAVFVGGQDPRSPLLIYGAPLGAPAPPPTRVPAGEKPVTTPFGRPPHLITTKGRKLLVRPLPAAEEPLPKAEPIEGVAVTKTLVDELSGRPACETESWTFALATQPDNRLAVVGVGKDRHAAFLLPEGTAPDTAVGCGFGKVVVEHIHEDTKRRHLAICDLDGECKISDNSPFRVWEEEHERRVNIIATKEGAVAALMAKSTSRWGLFVTESEDGKAFSIQRAVGEGSEERDRYELGALARVGSRIVLLLDANVTGRASRSWFVIVSDDGGRTWDKP